jgi:hypothetical protein
MYTNRSLCPIRNPHQAVTGDTACFTSGRYWSIGITCDEREVSAGRRISAGMDRVIAAIVKSREKPRLNCVTDLANERMMEVIELETNS